MGSQQDYLALLWEPWTPPALEDLLPQLSLEEQLRLQNHLREHHRARKWLNKDSPFSSQRSEGGSAAKTHSKGTRQAVHDYLKLYFPAYR
ncbi:hypothetical protein E2562_004393 [Oryza meyeriana var. granulata]|uniref:Uncharacterized protein n=1 Tax=Oryza meyeriana var. granulata TaxID=110450 RepID=A0A6G1CZA4_9ORYZ|nr:hypothetical protein E2562_004393 [Oryza meyeriana var. granulata]